MIIVKVFGGLGNQMFQYAAGRHLAHINNSELKLDLSWYDSSPDRTYDLGAFRINAGVASERDIDRLSPFMGKRAWVVSRIVRGLRKTKKLHRVNEKHFHFDPEVMRTPDHSYLEGYWQSEKYFKPISDIIRNDLSLKEPLSEPYETLLRKVKDTGSISLHVRRGDYAGNPEASSFHGTSSNEYYQAAMHYMAERTGAPHFFIFSDDIPWATSNLTLSHPHTFIDTHGRNRAQQDVILMSNCDHHILANSTFSWWGAWLNGSAHKMVVAPSRWFLDDRIDTGDLIPSSWVRL